MNTLLPLLLFLSQAFAEKKEYIINIYTKKTSIVSMTVYPEEESGGSGLFDSGGSGSFVFEWKNQPYKVEFFSDKGNIVAVLVEKWVWIGASSAEIFVITEEMSDNGILISDERWSQTMGGKGVFLTLSPK